MKLKRKLVLILVVALLSVFALSACEFFTPSLTAPKNLKISGTTLTWDKVDNADGYKVSINGVEKDATAATYPLASLSVSQTHLIKVKAIGDGKKYSDSGWSAPITYPDDAGFDFTDLDSIGEAMAEGNYTATTVTGTQGGNGTGKAILRFKNSAASQTEYFNDILSYDNIYAKDGDDYYNYSYSSSAGKWSKREITEERYKEIIESNQVYCRLLNNDFYDFNSQTQTYSIKQASASEIIEIMRMPENYELLSLTITCENNVFALNLSFYNSVDNVISGTISFSDIGTTTITIPVIDDNELDLDNISQQLQAGNYTVFQQMYSDDTDYIATIFVTENAFLQEDERGESYLTVTDRTDYYSYFFTDGEWTRYKTNEEEYLSGREFANALLNLFNSEYYDYDVDTKEYTIKTESIPTMKSLILMPEELDLLSLVIASENGQVAVRINYIEREANINVTLFYSDIGTTVIELPDEFIDGGEDIGNVIIN